MIPAGQVLCSTCASVFSSALYYANVEGDGKHTVVLYHYNHQYFVKPLDESGSGENIAETTYSLSRKTNLNAFPLKSIFVDIEKDGTTTTEEFKRHCPACIKKDNSETPIDSAIGYIPTYVIAVVGSRRTGKSSWLQSLTVPANIALLLQASNFPYKLKAVSFSNPVTHGKDTPIDDPGASCCLSISKNGEDVPFANILLMDFAGELFLNQNTENYLSSKARPLFEGTADFSGVDAVIFFDAFNDGLDEEYREFQTEAYTNVYEIGLLNNKPVAFVMNKADVLWKPAQESAEEFPAVTQRTFPAYCNSTAADLFDKDALIRRLLLQQVLVRNYSALATILLADNHNSSGFLVQSGSPQGQVIDGYHEKLDHSDAVNVYDPLLWALNQLDIFPFERPSASEEDA